MKTYSLLGMGMELVTAIYDLSECESNNGLPPKKILTWIPPKYYCR